MASATMLDSGVAFPVTGWVDGSPYLIHDADELVESFWIHVTDCMGHPLFVDAHGREVVFAIHPAVATETAHDP